MNCLGPWMGYVLWNTVFKPHIDSCQCFRVWARGAHGRSGGLRSSWIGPVGYPVHFSASKAGTRTLAPGLGEHTKMVLSDDGYTETEIEGLMSAGAVF